jgi:tricorn protease
MRHALIISLLCLFVPSVVRADAAKPLLLQKPTLSKSHIAFNFAGDLWIVGRDGGEARRLTSGVGLEYDPHFSPDGSQIAFTGEYDGNIDVYVIPTAGGEPRRLTSHPGNDVALGWTPDGKAVLFSSARNSYSRFNKLFTVALEGGGFPAELPLPMGEQGALSPDGKHIAYVPFWNRRSTPNAYVAWKRYRGGKASHVWIADLADSRTVTIPREDANDFCPMWVNGKVYFLSDRDGRVTLFSYDRAERKVRKELENNGQDLSYASTGPDAIVLEQFGDILIFDTRTRNAKRVDIRVTADFPATRTHFTKVGKKVADADVSPTGARAVFQARGEILTVPAEKGDIRNLTRTPAVSERDPAWSPDGKTIAYFSDESGEYMLHLRDAKGGGETRKLPLGDAPNFYFGPLWSPDSKKIAYADNRMQLWTIDVASGKNTKVDQHTYFSGPFFDTTWSPDSRWLGYTKVMLNRLRAVFLYDTTADKSHRVTDGMSDARHTTFDKNGKYLYFTASTDIGPTTNGIDMSGMFRPVTRSVYLVVLDKSLPSPLSPESDEEKERAADASEEKIKAGKTKPKAMFTKIDLEGIDQRILGLPLPGRNYTGLQAGKPGLLYLLERPVLPTPTAPGGRGSGPMGDTTVLRFDLDKRKADKVLDNVSSFRLAANGDKVLYRQGDKWHLTAVPSGAAGAGLGALGGRLGGAAAAQTVGPAAGVLKLDDMEVQVDPRAEWRQMYRETWRIQRDFLYDPGYHGYDIAAAEKRYAAYLDGLAHRVDLNYLFNEMLGDMTLGHTYISGGDFDEPRKVKGGLLGADYKIDNGRYRFTRVYSGENWTPQFRAPLTQPGVNVKEGEYLLAVGGKELTANDNLFRAFEAIAGKSILLKVGPTPDGKGSREVIVVPVEAETQLRHLAWVEGNRRKVDEMSGGKLAYVYLPDTGFGGYQNFNRFFFAQVDKQGVVIDERFNGGGKAADYMIDYLRRPLLNYWTARMGGIYTTPGGAIFGPKAMIINEFAGSGGDALPWYFRKSKLGPLVGKRTWGGLVGISGYPPLLDGGSVTAPSFAFFSPDGTWDVENKGVAPDVEVEHDPYEVRNGRDPQLERAVALVMEALERNPPQQPTRPAYPNYHQKSAVSAPKAAFFVSGPFTELEIKPASVQRTSISMRADKNFDQVVKLSAEPSGKGITAVLEPSTVKLAPGRELKCDLTINAASGVVPGEYRVRVVATPERGNSAVIQISLRVRKEKSR